MIVVDRFEQKDLAAFRRYQQASRDTLREAAGSLQAGMTEAEATRRIRKSFHRQGVHHYFHVPIVLFGERTAYPGDFGAFEAAPTGKILEPGMAVILDASPIYEGYLVDTSLSVAFGENPLHERLLDDLAPFRDLILAEVLKGTTFAGIAKRVDAEIRTLGYENCHRKHIAAVLGHRVLRLWDGALGRVAFKGHGVQSVGWFVVKSLLAERGWAESPNWNHRRSSDHRPSPGLWAVEPHFAQGGVGVKFEEILVVTEDDAHWLEPDAPGR